MRKKHKKEKKERKEKKKNKDEKIVQYYREKKKIYNGPKAAAVTGRNAR